MAQPKTPNGRARPPYERPVCYICMYEYSTRIYVIPFRSVVHYETIPNEAAHKSAPFDLFSQFPFLTSGPEDWLHSRV